jgi:hypothetical protein
MEKPAAVRTSLVKLRLGESVYVPFNGNHLAGTNRPRDPVYCGITQAGEKTHNQGGQAQLRNSHGDSGQNGISSDAINLYAYPVFDQARVKKVVSKT